MSETAQGHAEMLPCPFCGGAAEIERRGDYRASTIYQCQNCSCRLETGETWGFGNVWNRRTPRPEASDASDIVERRLREYIDVEVACGMVDTIITLTFLREIADALAALRAELAAVKRREDDLRASNNLKGKAFADASAKLRAAEAEVARLKDAVANSTNPLLAEMAKHIGWELDWGEKDPDWEGSECGWRVHERNGNRNDREWKMLGFGATPEEALRVSLTATKGG